MVSSLYLMPTTACNCACTYCYCREKTRVGGFDHFVRIADSFTEHVLGSGMEERPQIRFTGGEPWLAGELLLAVAERFLGRTSNGWVVVNTNGTIIPGNGLETFRGNSRLIHVVSLDGPGHLHDSRRRTVDGRGTFQRVVMGVKTLQELGLPVCLNAVLDHESSRHLPGLMRFVVDELGIRELSLSLLYRETFPNPWKQRFELLRSAYAEAANHGIRLGGHHRLLLGPWIPELRCMAGITTAVVDPEGGVYRCQRLVGRVDPDTVWNDGFDWAGFRSPGGNCGVCGDADDISIGVKLYEMYQEEHPGYLDCHPLDRILFGVIP
jgi:sulfatase maturation enzyme AslB (radical SAM superfamily)